MVPPGARAWTSARAGPAFRHRMSSPTCAPCCPPRRARRAHSLNRPDHRVVLEAELVAGSPRRLPPNPNAARRPIEILRVPTLHSHQTIAGPGQAPLPRTRPTRRAPSRKCPGHCCSYTFASLELLRSTEAQQFDTLPLIQPAPAAIGLLGKPHASRSLRRRTEWHSQATVTMVRAPETRCRSRLASVPGPPPRPPVSGRSEGFDHGGLEPVVEARAGDRE